jgi:hypothetical protein
MKDGIMAQALAAVPLPSVEQLIERLSQALQTPDMDREQLAAAVEEGVRGAVREIAMGFFHDAALLEDEARNTVEDPSEMWSFLYADQCQRRAELHWQTGMMLGQWLRHRGNPRH